MIPKLLKLGRLAMFAAVLLLVAACGGQEDETLAGYERTPEPTVGSVTIAIADGTNDEFAFQAKPGKLLMVTFGFTNCPDICPTTLADARIAFGELGERADDVDLAWVSIDPVRDTDEVTTTYVQSFIDDAIPLRTGDTEQLAIVADAFGVTYIVQDNDAGETEVAHTPNVYLVDDTGSIILTWPFGVPSLDIASDLTIMLDRRS